MMDTWDSWFFMKYRVFLIRLHLSSYWTYSIKDCFQWNSVHVINLLAWERFIKSKGVQIVATRWKYGALMKIIVINSMLLLIINGSKTTCSIWKSTSGKCRIAVISGCGDIFLNIKCVKESVSGRNWMQA